MRRELCEFRWVHMPYEAVAGLLGERSAELLLPAVTSAARSADTPISGPATLTAPVGRRLVAKDVEIELGAVEVVGAPFPIVRLPVAWKAAERPALFPTMTGQLEAYPISPGMTQLSFQGTYRPPLGAVGEAADALLLHRVAERSVDRFLRVIAQRLRRVWIADQQPGKAPAGD